MANILIATNELVDAVNSTGSTTVSSTSELADAPVSGLANMNLSTKWMASLNVSTAAVIVNFGSTVVFNLVALLGTNLDSTAKMQIRAASAEASLTVGPSLSTTITFWPAGTSTTWAARSGFVKFASDQRFQHLRVDVSTSQSLVSAGISAGRLYVSDAFQPTKNSDYPLSLSWVDESKITKTYGGATYVDQKQRFRRADFTLKFLTQAEAMGTVILMDRLFGISKDVLVILDPAETAYLQDFIIYGRMRDITPVDLHAFSLYEKTYRIEEMI